jgi:aryl-alcohol dehydrogenase-like predicted oxidoreductase
MRYRTFGATDIELSALTFGSMRFAPKTTGADATAGKRALEAALASGINTVHSSFEYGTRWAVGEVLRDHPKRLDVQHIIKAPVPEFDEAGFSETSFRRMVEDALRETGAERIAIVQHLQRGIGRDVINDARGDPDRLAAMPEINEKLAAAADRLKAEGKIGALACFPYTEGFAGPAIASGIFDGVIAYFSLVETELVPHLAGHARARHGLRHHAPAAPGAAHRQAPRPHHPAARRPQARSNLRRGLPSPPTPRGRAWSRAPATHDRRHPLRPGRPPDPLGDPKHEHRSPGRGSPRRRRRAPPAGRYPNPRPCPQHRVVGVGRVW